MLVLAECTFQMSDSPPFVWLYYHLQNERGESASNPNACKIYPSTVGKVTLRDVIDGFPLTGTSSFHFRFQVYVDKVSMMLDLTNPNDNVPLTNGNIIAKILRLGWFLGGGKRM